MVIISIQIGQTARFEIYSKNLESMILASTFLIYTILKICEELAFTDQDFFFFHFLCLIHKCVKIIKGRKN